MTDDRWQRALQGNRASAFEPGFADRVMARVRAESEPAGLGAVLQRQFLRLAPAAFALLLMFSMRNLLSSDRRDLNAALGLPTVTLEAAYALQLGGGE
jgi:hypothetical protein